LKVRDRERSEAFYSGVLGLTVGNHHDVAIVGVGDGPNAVELYVDSSDAWTSDPQLVATGGPLEL